MVRLARLDGPEPVSLATIADQEGISSEYAAKILRVLREGGLVSSTRGASGGYHLARPAQEIGILEVLAVLDGPLLPEDWCGRHAGKLDACVHGSNCAIDALWRHVGQAVTLALAPISLADLSNGRLHLLTLVNARAVALAERGAAGEPA
jgi:Rrf2 family protein